MIDSFYLSRNIDFFNITVVSLTFMDIDTKYFAISQSLFLSLSLSFSLSVSFCLFLSLSLSLSLRLSETEYRFSIYQSSSHENLWMLRLCYLQDNRFLQAE